MCQGFAACGRQINFLPITVVANLWHTSPGPHEHMGIWSSHSVQHPRAHTDHQISHKAHLRVLLPSCEPIKVPKSCTTSIRACTDHLRSCRAHAATPYRAPESLKMPPENHYRPPESRTVPQSPYKAPETTHAGLALHKLV